MATKRERPRNPTQTEPTVNATSKGFEFNPGGLSGVPGELRAGLQRFLSGRERQINSQTHRTLACVGGPFAGKTIDIAEGSDGTAHFAVGAFAGRYVVRKPRDSRSGEYAEWRQES
jgi:hypothetical protein